MRVVPTPREEVTMWLQQVWADYSMSLGIMQARQPRWREIGVVVTRVAEVGSLSAKAKMAIKFLSSAYFIIFATNALFFACNSV